MELANILYVLIFALVISFFFVTTKSMYNRLDKGNQPLIGLTITFTSVIFALLLGFTISNFWNRYNQIDTLINQEVDNLKSLYRVSSKYPGTENIKLAVENYLKDIIQVQFPLLEKGNLQFPSDQFYVEILNQVDLYVQAYPTSPLSNIIYTYLPPRGEFKSLLTNNYGTYLIFIIILIGILTLIGFWFVKNDSFGIQFIIDFGIVAVISLSIYLLLDLQNPFTGIFKITPQNYQALLDEINKHVQ